MRGCRPEGGTAPHDRGGKWMRIRKTAVAVAMVGAAAFAAPAAAAPPTDTKALQDAVQVGDGDSGIRAHLKALQEIADREGANGTRATGTQGHADSLAYVKQQLEATGYY